MDYNFDAMTSDELMAFWLSTNSVRPIATARKLFPNRPVGYVRAAKDLGCYASNKATAQTQRIAGNIETALSYEAICDRIYKRLPEFARW